ncbi:PEP-CTERM sorting domain-containing protein [Coleofasciculus sp.]|uniref:PEP-CTERM sorting domain-containing protein n=1 Tax=Coleofasciculus sp. TaxID=3100458 RepID=UPI003A22FF62
MKCFSSIATVGTTLVALGTVMACGNGALADPLNDRPVSPLGDNGTEDTLQEVLDSITESGKIDAVNDQKPFALFKNTSGSGLKGTLVAEIAGFDDINVFGLYSADDITNKAPIFQGSNKPFDRVSLDFYNDGTVKMTGATDPIGTGFNGAFGFYLDTPNDIFYTEDSHNKNNDPQALVYQGDNDTVLQIGNFQAGKFVDTEFIVAFEDKPFSSADKDFNDMVVHVAGVEPVPEPMTILGSTLALGFGGLFKRQMSKRQKN